MLPNTTLFRFIKKAVNDKILLYICDRKRHPKKFPTKVYFINNLKTKNK